MRETLSSEISPYTIATAQWWQDRASAFEGLDKSLYLEEIIEELEGIEQRKYLRIQGSTDLSRAQFENWATEIGLVLNPPPDVEPFQHCCYKFRKDQEENNDDYRRRPRGKEVVLTWIVKNDEEIKKENPADLVKWSKARREAEVVINRDDSIDSRTVDLRQVHFDKAVEIATKHGVSSQFLLKLKQVKNELESTKTTCTVPNAGQAAAAFCTRIANRAKVGPHRKRQYTRKGLVPKELNDMVIQLWRQHPDWTNMEMCKRLDSLVDRNFIYEPLPAWKKKAGERRLWIELVDHSATEGDVRPFLSGRKKKAFSPPSI